MSKEVIMIPKDQYEKMLEAYDAAMEQLAELRQFLDQKNENAPD